MVKIQKIYYYGEGSRRGIWEWMLIGDAQGETLQECCDNYAKFDSEFAKTYDPKRLTTWGYKLALEKNVIKEQGKQCIYLLSEIWFDPMENEISAAMGYKPKFCVETEKEAKKLCDNELKELPGRWPIDYTDTRVIQIEDKYYVKAFKFDRITLFKEKI